MNLPLVRFLAIAVAVILILGGEGAIHLLRCAETLRVGILPFNIYSSEKVDYLQDIVASRLAENMQQHHYISVVEPTTPPVEKAGKEELSTEDLDQMAKTLGVDFLIYGSLTMIENEVSIDARAYTTIPEEKTFRSFVVGSDFDRLIVRIENRISEHLLAVANRLSTPEKALVLEEALPEEPGLSLASPKEIDQAGVPQASSSPAEAHRVAAIQQPSVAGEEEQPPSRLSSSDERDEPPASAAKAISAPRQEVKPARKSTGQLPFNITSDRMVADNRKSTVTFFGDVKASNEDLLVFSDEMAIVYTKERQIEHVAAHGNVRISKKDITASCQMANFLQGEQKIILTGKPKVWQGNNMVTGEKITILLEEDKIVVVGQKDRVNVVIYPGNKDEN